MVDAGFRRVKWGRDLYDYLMKFQDGCCAICLERKGGKLVMDHSHVTGEVRGLLCQRCNMALGLVRDETTLLRRLSEYLEGFATVP